MNVPDEPSPVPVGISARLHKLKCRIELVRSKHFPDDWVVNLVDLVHPLRLGVLQKVPRCERSVQRDEDVLVYGAGDQASAEPLVVGGKIGSSTAEGDSKWSPGDDQRMRSCSANWVCSSGFTWNALTSLRRCWPPTSLRRFQCQGRVVATHASCLRKIQARRRTNRKAGACLDGQSRQRWRRVFGPGGTDPQDNPMNPASVPTNYPHIDGQAVFDLLTTPRRGTDPPTCRRSAPPGPCSRCSISRAAFSAAVS